MTTVAPELVRVYFPDVDGGTKQVTSAENIRLGQEWRQGKWHARIPPPLEPAQPQAAGESPASFWGTVQAAVAVMGMAQIQADLLCFLSRSHTNA